MKIIILVLSQILFIVGLSSSQTEGKTIINDGLYPISKLGTDSMKFDSIKTNEVIIQFNYLFIEKTDLEYSQILVDTTEYVPLELEELPTAVQQTEKKKKLMFSLTKDASEKLKVFTENHIMSRVALVVDGQAVSIHKIREPITSGQLQITTCSDNACERLVVKMKSNLKQ